LEGGGAEELGGEEGMTEELGERGWQRSWEGERERGGN